MQPPLKRRLCSLVNRFGLDIHRFHPEASVALRRARLMRDEGISLILDVGAHEGEYGAELRRHGYRRRIVSFEPLASAHARLEERARAEPAWFCARYALGERGGSAVMNVAGNSVSSSLLPMTDLHQRGEPGSRYQGTETVELRRLDSLADQYVGADDSVLLKIDTQGYEAQVMAGAQQTLAKCRMLEIELSTVTLYEGQASMAQMLKMVEDAGFGFVSLERGFTDLQSYRVYQYDGIFVRVSPPADG